MDENVLKKSSLCEAFKHIIPIDQLQQDFSKAFITKLNYHKSEKRIELCLDISQQICPDKILQLEKTLTDYFSARVDIRPGFTIPFPEELDDWHKEIIIRYTCCSKSHLAPFLKNAEFRLRGRQLMVCLPGSGCSVLKASGAGKHMEKIIRMLFQSDVRVSFSETEDKKRGTVDYIAEKMESEARIVAQVLSSQESGVPLPKDKKGSSASAAQEKGYGKYVRNGGSRGQNFNNQRVIYGRPFKGEPSPMVDVDINSGSVVLSGEIIRMETRELKNGRTLLSMDITDRTSSLTCKAFAKEQEMEVLKEKLKVGSHVRVNGDAEFDAYEKELTIKLRAIEYIEANPKVRADQASQKRVELHLHTQMSQLDAITSVKDVITRAADWGHKAIAITDHGVVQAFPEAQEVAAKLKKSNREIKVIYGMEAYLLVDERYNSNGELDYKSADTYHAVILVKNQTGLKNLYKIVSESHLNYFYKRPRVPWSLFEKYRDGLIIGSACEAGELYRALREGKPCEDIEAIAARYDYLEIQPIGNNQFLVREGMVKDEEALRDLNRQIVALGEQLGKPVVATCDVHFLDPDDAVFRQILQTGQGYKDADKQAPIYFRTTDEMLEEFSYLGEEMAFQVVVTNPAAISESIEEVLPIPDGTFPPSLEGAEEDVKRISEDMAREMYGDSLPELVEQRVSRELGSIIKNGFSSLYMIARKLVQKSLSDGYMVGSRGSVGSSFIAFLTGITEVNALPPHYRCGHCRYSEFFVKDKQVACGFDLPDKACPNCGNPLIKDGHDIPFETFLGFDGDKEPDIDLNFSGEYQPRAHKYTEELFGEGYTFRAGTIATIAEKTAFGFAKKFLEERGIPGTRAELNRLAAGCMGTKRTTGQHPGGVMVVPRHKEIYDFSPIQRPADDTSSEIITTHFDYHSISGRILKLDILGHDDPTVIRMLEDLTGVDARAIPLGEKKTMGIFSGTEPLGVTPEQIDSQVGTIGVPEFGTKFVRQMLVDTKPTTFGELIRISGLSHGTDVWLNNAQDLVRNGVATLSEVICTRDDIMTYLLMNDLPPLTSFKIMESVRKGRGLTPEQETLMEEKGVPGWYIESCKKIKYMFPKAHAAAYVMMAFRIAWFKVYYPEAFYATYFSVRADSFDANIISRGPDAVSLAIKDIEDKGKMVTQKEKDLLTILEVAREMYARGINCLPVDLYKSHATRFIITEDGILPPLTALQGLGTAAAANIVDSRKDGEFVSIEDLKMKSGISKAVIEILSEHGCLDGMDESSQLSLFGLG